MKIVIVTALGSFFVAFAVWLLNELSFHFRERLENKKAIGRALTLLLEIRHRYLRVIDEKDVDAYFERMKIPTRLRLYYKRLIHKIIPLFVPQLSDGLVSQYEEAIKHLSGLNPALGFQLMAKDLVGKLINMVNQMMALMGASSQQTETMRAAFIKEIDGHFVEVIEKLSKKHSWRTQKAVKNILEKASEKVTHFEEVLKNLLSPEVIAQMDQQLANVPEPELEQGFAQLEQTLLSQLTAQNNQIQTSVPK